MDYERRNAQEWDLNAPIQQSRDEWQTIRGSKRSDQHQSKPPPQQSKGKPSALPQRKTPASSPSGKENAASRRWQNVRGDQQQRDERRAPPKLIDVDESEAQLSWRNHNAPKDTIRIRNEVVLHDRTHENIAREHGAFVCTDYAEAKGSEITFGIWGDDKAVIATKRAITAHVENFFPPSKFGRSVAFGKVQSLTPELRKRAEKKWKRDVERQKWRQFPPPDMRFGAIGSFLWPVNEYKVEEILGMSCEALDPIRMDNKCYIIFSKDQSLFKVMGKAESVKEGLLRIRKTCFQIAARQIPTVRKYLLHWPDASNHPSHVSLRRYNNPVVLSSVEAMEGKQSQSPIGEGTHNDDTHLTNQSAYSETIIMNALLKALNKLQYYRGNIQLRIRMGTFLAKQYMEPDDGLYPLNEFEDMINMSQFTGEVTQELGDKEIEQKILSSFQTTKGLLSAQHVWQDMSDQKPIYCAIFNFSDEAGDLRLSASWQDAQDSEKPRGAFDDVSKHWTRLERDTGDAAAIVDVCLTNLDSGGRAWHFDMQAAQAVDETRLPKSYVDFAATLKVDASAIRKQSVEKCFVIYRPIAKLKSIQQRTSYRYGITTSDYTLEISQFQNRIYPPRTNPSVLTVYEPTVYEPRWSLSVYRNAWDTMFTDNERLSVGEGVKWERDLETWFPKDDAVMDVLGMGANADGFKQLMEMLKKIGKVVAETKEEDLVGEMAVG